MKQEEIIDRVEELYQRAIAKQRKGNFIDAAEVFKKAIAIAEENLPSSYTLLRGYGYITQEYSYIIEAEWRKKLSQDKVTSYAKKDKIHVNKRIISKKNNKEINQLKEEITAVTKAIPQLLEEYLAYTNKLVKQLKLLHNIPDLNKDIEFYARTAQGLYLFYNELSNQKDIVREQRLNYLQQALLATNLLKEILESFTKLDKKETTTWILFIENKIKITKTPPLKLLILESSTTKQESNLKKEIAAINAEIEQERQAAAQQEKESKEKKIKADEAFEELLKQEQLTRDNTNAVIDDSNNNLLAHPPLATIEKTDDSADAPISEPELPAYYQSYFAAFSKLKEKQFAEAKQLYLKALKEASTHEDLAMKVAIRSGLADAIRLVANNFLKSNKTKEDREIIADKLEGLTNYKQAVNIYKEAIKMARFLIEVNENKLFPTQGLYDFLALELKQSYEVIASIEKELLAMNDRMQAEREKAKERKGNNWKTNKEQVSHFTINRQTCAQALNQIQELKSEITPAQKAINYLITAVSDPSNFNKERVTNILSSSSSQEELAINQQGDEIPLTKAILGDYFPPIPAAEESWVNKTNCTRLKRSHSFSGDENCTSLRREGTISNNYFVNFILNPRNAEKLKQQSYCNSL